MLKYIEKSNYTLTMLLELARIKDNDADVETFQDLSLEFLVGMYCSPGLKFAAGPVKCDLEKCSIKPINAVKMYQALQSLSLLAKNDPNSRKTSTINTPVISEDGDDVTIIEDEEEVYNNLDQSSIDLGSTMQQSADDSQQRDDEEFFDYVVRTEKV